MKLHFIIFKLNKKIYIIDNKGENCYYFFKLRDKNELNNKKKKKVIA